jgi:RNA polymerase sigma-70 factor (ECF subfamily)
MNTALLTQTEPDLAAAAQRGDAHAYGELVARCRAGVVNVVYRMCGDSRLAEEAAQEAFLRAWQRLPGYRPGHSFRAWVYRIAVNAALDALRRERRLVSLEDLLDGGAQETCLPEPGGGPEELVEERQQAERVRRAVLALPPASRAVLVLREYGGMSYSEIAGALDIPLGTVMSRLNSARGQLRQALAGILEVL